MTATLTASPAEAGYDARAWTPQFVRDHIADAFDVEYSLAHMYRVMKRTGLSIRQPRPRHYNADPPSSASGVQRSKKWQALKAAGYTIVAIDQHTQVVKTKQTRGWFPVNSRPRLPVSGGRTSLNLLGAVTEGSDRFITMVTGRLTSEVAKHFVWALQQSKKLAVVLDNAPYFIEKFLDFQKLS